MVQKVIFRYCHENKSCCKLNLCGIDPKIPLTTKIFELGIGGRIRLPPHLIGWIRAHTVKGEIIGEEAIVILFLFWFLYLFKLRKMTFELMFRKCPRAMETIDQLFLRFAKDYHNTQKWSKIPLFKARF